MKDAVQSCPECNADVEIHTGYVKWCPQCNWNVHPHIPEPQNIIESTYAKVGLQQSQRLFEQMLSADSLAPKTTLSKTLAYSLASVVHLFYVGIFLLGMWLIVANWPLITAIAAGVFLLLIAVVSRPRFGKWPVRAKSRSELPATYALVDQISEVLNAPKIDGITIDANFNASYARIGLANKQLLVLGLPLFYYLNNQERIALIGHELAHGINGDSSRGQYIGIAINALIEWYIIVRPDAIVDSGDTPFALFLIPINILRALLARLILFIASGLSHLLWHDSQRAEYMADAIAAKVAGSASAIALLEKLYLDKSYYVAAGRYKLNSKLRKASGIFEYTQEQLQTVPPIEIERIRRVQEVEGSRLNVTHPPTPFRRRFLEEKTISTPMIEAETIDFDGIIRELSMLEDSVQSDILNQR